MNHLDKLPLKIMLKHEGKTREDVIMAYESLSTYVRNIEFQKKQQDELREALKKVGSWLKGEE